MTEEGTFTALYSPSDSSIVDIHIILLATSTSLIIRMPVALVVGNLWLVYGL